MRNSGRQCLRSAHHHIARGGPRQQEGHRYLGQVIDLYYKKRQLNKRRQISKEAFSVSCSSDVVVRWIFLEHGNHGSDCRTSHFQYCSFDTKLLFLISLRLDIAQGEARLNIVTRLGLMQAWLPVAPVVSWYHAFDNVRRRGYEFRIPVGGFLTQTSQ